MTIAQSQFADDEGWRAASGGSNKRPWRCVRRNKDGSHKEHYNAGNRLTFFKSRAAATLRADKLNQAERIAK